MMLNKLNPLNSLFGRIFASFWLITILIISTGIGLALYTSSLDHLIEVNARQLADVERIEHQLSRFVRSRPYAKLEDKLNNASQRTRSYIVLVSEKDKLITRPHAPIPIPDEKLIALSDHQEVIGLRYRGSIFYGPVKLTINKINYSAFIGKPLSLSRFRQINRQQPYLMPIIAILLSGALCFWLSWSLVKPLRRLQQASHRLAKGDLSARVETGLRREDEIGQLNRDFNSMSAKIEQLMNGQKRLLADISHELRSPLARLQLAIGIAQQTGSTEASHLERIEKEGHEIETMIERVLQLSRLQSHQKTIVRVPIDLHMLIQKLVQDAQFEAKPLNKTVKLVASKSAMLVLGDDMLLASALENVLRNAVKYSESQVEMIVLTQDSHYLIQICDDGPGIPSAELSNIFSPFYRLSFARSRETGGAGLGLSIAKEAITAHNGTIKAMNHSPHGLLIEITLPIFEENNK